MEFAMKAAGQLIRVVILIRSHDKKGLQLFLDISFYHQLPLRVPLMVLIDHQGILFLKVIVIQRV